MSALPFNLMQVLATSGGARRKSSFALGPQPTNQRLSPAQTQSLRRARGRKAAATPEPAPALLDVTTPEGAAAEKDRRFADTWDGTPVVADQYENPRWEATWKEGAQECRVWNLRVPEDLDAYNDLLSKAEPPGAPLVRLVCATGPTVAQDGACLVIVHFRNILWKKELA